jgi:hypothetical protein
MPYPAELSQWKTEVSMRLGHLSRSQAWGLALYSYAVVLTQSCGMSHVAYFVARLLHQRENSVRQRLREGLYEAGHKRGAQRREVDVTLCFAPLLGWVQALWQSEDQTMFLALDATTLRQVFTVLTVSVMVGGCALPVGWVILPATQPGRWRPHWERLLGQVAPGLSPTLTVWVMADRGLYARWLFRRIQAHGWHPLLRVNAQGVCWERHTGRRWKLAALAQHCRQRLWRAEVTCFQRKARLTCTLVAMWDDDQAEAWLLLTDCAPSDVNPSWYALRMWIEAGFKALKSAGFHWERTRMTDPARAERLWLVLALASLRAAMTAAPTPDPLPRWAPPLALTQHRPPRKSPNPPRLNLLKRGMLAQLAASICHHPLPSRLIAPPLPPTPLLEVLSL